MRSHNPVLNDRAFRGVPVTAGQAMTVQGTVNKTALLLAILLLSSTWTWSQAGLMGNLPVLAWIGAIGGFIVALVTVFKRTLAPVTAPIYAALEGCFLGGVSAIFEMRYPGIVMQAVSLTFFVLAALLVAYTSRVIPVTQNFRLGIFAATGGIFFFYLFSWILSFFGVSMPLIHSSGTFGILFSLFVVVIAALNLVLDFDFIEHAADAGAPKYMEWFGAFGLLVTLVWLYMEILRLLSKLRNR